MDFEKELQQVAKQYEDEGYAVTLRPTADQLPSFARGFDLDLLATRPRGNVLVEVKRDRTELEADPSVSHQAEVINAQPGWRYDLIVLGEDDPFRRITRGAREPSDDEIERALGEVETLIQIGQHRAALVFSWAALEAAMRQIASSVELYLPRKAPTELLRTLYGNGLLSREEFNLLRDSFRLRTEIVHGLISPAVPPDVVRGVVAATRRLLTGKPDARGVAG